MKQYSRELKRWVTEEELQKHHAKRDKKLCRGGKPHDYVLVLPFHMTYTDAYKFNPEAYYKLMDEVTANAAEVDRKLAEMGIKKRYSSWRTKETRCYMCSVCKKQKYEYEKT